jgi:dienelactone hydrolase
MTHKLVLALAACALAPVAALAEVKTQEVEYKAGDATLVGYLAYDDAAKDKRPGVLVVHEWWGHNEHARKQAERLAAAGFVGFALDMYGKGKVATHPKDAEAFMTEATQDSAVVVARFNAAIEELKKQPQVDPAKIGVVGYCFGGTVGLEMARAGADLDVVGTFHAGLAPRGEPAKKGTMKAAVIAQTGGGDPMVPKAQVDGLKKELKAAGVPSQVIVYPKAKHSFTNPDAAKAGMDALAYDADADKKSFDAFVKFAKKHFK